MFESRVSFVMFVRRPDAHVRSDVSQSRLENGTAVVAAGKPIGTSEQFVDGFSEFMRERPAGCLFERLDGCGGIRIGIRWLPTSQSVQTLAQVIGKAGQRNLFKMPAVRLRPPRIAVRHVIFVMTMFLNFQRMQVG